jgi:hypothetical protein
MRRDSTPSSRFFVSGSQPETRSWKSPRGSAPLAIFAPKSMTSYCGSPGAPGAVARTSRKTSERLSRSKR